ncbi:MAG: 5-(carboxyamino)imidazole ribonucleotide synthase [Acidothermaceae bacterium]
MVGAGQLARMTQPAAIALGIGFRLLAETASDSAALVTPDVVVGDYRNLDDLIAFAAGCDVVTFDHEHVPLEHVEKLVAAGVRVFPGPQALPYVQDKLRMRERLGTLGLPIPAWRPVESVAEVARFAETYGWPVVAKAASGGYDGKGVWVLRAPSDAAALLDRGGVRLYVEQHVAFDRELAALVARSASGRSVAWPVVQTLQDDGICVEVLAPAPDLAPQRAREATELAQRIAEELDVVGLLAVELFETPDGVLINELAMRPHNSGHWTIEGSVTSQFEQHLRAVLDWPLGDARARAPYTVMANLLGGGGPQAADLAARIPAALADADVRLHLYGKAVRAGRKIGHVTISGDEVADLRARARRATDLLRGEPA